MFCQELHIAKAKSDETIKKFWNSVKSFMKNKCTVSKENIVIKAQRSYL